MQVAGNYKLIKIQKSKPKKERGKGGRKERIIHTF